MKTQQKSIFKLALNGLALAAVLNLSACSDNDAETTDETTTEVMADDMVMTDNDFTGYDSNQDGYLDEDEYSGGFFRNLDGNTDGKVDETEWNDGMTNNGVTGQSWADWDIDRDGFLNDGEYRDGYNKNNWSRAWDTDQDNRLSMDEYNNRNGMRPNDN